MREHTFASKTLVLGRLALIRVWAQRNNMRDQPCHAARGLPPKLDHARIYSIFVALRQVGAGNKKAREIFPRVRCVLSHVRKPGSSCGIVHPLWYNHRNACSSLRGGVLREIRGSRDDMGNCGQIDIPTGRCPSNFNATLV